MSASAPSFYPGPLPDESALDSGLLEALSTVDNTFDFDFPDNSSVSSSIGGSTGVGGGTGSLSGGFNNSSLLGQFSNNGSTEPVSIPGSHESRHMSFNSQQSHSPTSPSLQQHSGPNSSYYINQVRPLFSYFHFWIFVPCEVCKCYSHPSRSYRFLMRCRLSSRYFA